MPLQKETYKNTHLGSIKLDWPDISIVIIVKNEVSNLADLIPLLLRLEYQGHFDIHILDDASTDGTHELIHHRFGEYKQIHFHTSLGGFSSGKKQRLSDLSKIETYATVIFTDADCRPGPKWLSSMAAHAAHHDILLGYSPYYQDSGSVNKLIQFETGLTGLMYMGLGRLGLAYMGVGRNILYAKKVLFSSTNLTRYKEVLSGDDDLTVNELKVNIKPGINLDPASFVYSIPKSNLADWIKQKQRHVSTAKYYTISDQAILFSFYSSHVAWWIGILFLIFMDIRFAAMGLVLKCIWYVVFRYLNSKVFKYVFSWSKMISADLLYALCLVYLLPAATIRKVMKW
jgi:glycosyltransferase involved in cell wall biosynthesis